MPPFQGILDYDSSTGGSGSDGGDGAPVGWEDTVAASRGQGQRRLSKAELWEGDTDDEAEQLRASARRQSRKAATTFVSGGTTAAGPPPNRDKPAFTVSYVQQSDGGDAENESGTVATNRQPGKAKKIGKDFGFLKTSGKADVILRMMRSVGWREGEGMGARGQGISEAIEMKARPARAGVGAVQEKTGQQQRWERERRGGGVKDSILRADAAAAAAEGEGEGSDAEPELRHVRLQRRRRQGGWRRTDTPAVAAAKVIDMRGEAPVEVGSVAAAPVRAAASAAAPERSLGALRRGLALAVRGSEHRVRATDARLETDRARLKELSKRLADDAELHQRRTRVCAAIDGAVAALTGLRSRVVAVLRASPVGADSTPGNCTRALAALRTAHRTHFAGATAQHREAYDRVRDDVDAAVLSLAALLLDRLYAGWDAAADPLLGLDEARRWKAAFGDAADAALGASVGSRLRTFVSVRWRPQQAALAAVVAEWLQALPHDDALALLDGSVLPRLRAELDGGGGGASVGDLLLPWAGLCAALDDDDAADGRRTASALFSATVLPYVATAVGRELASMAAAPPAVALTRAHQLLAPWHGVLDAKAFSALATRHAASRVYNCVQAQAVMPPDQQCGWACVDAVAAWADVAGLSEVAARALAADLLPRMAAVLAAYLRATADFASANAFVRAAVSRLPAAVVAHPAFAVAAAKLTALQAAAADWHRTRPAQPPDGAWDAAARDAEAAARLAAAGPPPSAVAGALRSRISELQREQEQPSDDGLSVREVLERVAADADLQFVPRRGGRVDGKQVFVLGALPVLFDGRRLLAQLRGNDWSAVSIREAVAAAGRRPD